MINYHELLAKVLNKGSEKPSGRPNMPNTLSLFGERLEYNLQEYFPIVNTKPVSFKNIVVELLWFLRGDGNIKYMVENGCNIWNEDAYNYYVKRSQLAGAKDVLSFEDFPVAIKEGNRCEELQHEGYKYGDTGEQYPRLWRSWRIAPNMKIGVDQIADIVEGLRTNPYSRRHILSAWNPATVYDMALPACHSFVQFNVRPAVGVEPDGLYLDCKFTMRSVDTMLGLPYNIASYALLTHILAQASRLKPGRLTADLGDTHIYMNHIEAVKEQLGRNFTRFQQPNLLMHEFDWDSFPNNVDKLHKDIFWLRGYQHNHYPALVNPTPLNTGLK